MPALALEIDRPGAVARRAPFEEDVLAAISRLGLRRRPPRSAAPATASTSRVRHPDRPGEFALAVECDGAAYHSAASARDRDRLRQRAPRARLADAPDLGNLVVPRPRQRVAQAACGDRGRHRRSRRRHRSHEPRGRPHSRSRRSTSRPRRTGRSRTPLTPGEPSRPTTRCHRWKPAVAVALPGAGRATESPVHQDLVYRRVREAYDVGSNRTRHQGEHRVRGHAPRLSTAVRVRID